MAYEKQTWVTGDTITANKLNHIEDGIASGGGADLTFSLAFGDGAPSLSIEGISPEDMLDKFEDGTLTAKLLVEVFLAYCPCISLDSATAISCYFFSGDGSRMSIGLSTEGEGIIRNGEDTIPFTYTYADGVYTCSFEESDAPPVLPTS